jgi:hypothetical protein
MLRPSVKSPIVCLAAHVQSLIDGLPDMSNFYRHPGRAGGSLADARFLWDWDVLWNS